MRCLLARQCLTFFYLHRTLYLSSSSGCLILQVSHLGPQIFLYYQYFNPQITPQNLSAYLISLHSLMCPASLI